MQARRPTELPNFMSLYGIVYHSNMRSEDFIPQEAIKVDSKVLDIDRPMRHSQRINNGFNMGDKHIEQISSCSILLQ
jgi:hypothetical protein